MKYLVLLLLIVSCGKEAPVVSGGPMVRETSDALLRPFLDSFLEKSTCFNRNPQYTTLRMTIDWEGMSVAGKCIEYTDGSAKVVIDGPTWVTISDINRERLIYHELGHCALGLDHIDQALEPGLMTPSLREVLSGDYVTGYDLIIRELFSNTASDCTFEYLPYEETP